MSKLTKKLKFSLKLNILCGHKMVFALLILLCLVDSLLVGTGILDGIE